MLHLESTVSVAALITIAGAVLRLTFQHGRTIETLTGLGSKVESLVAEFKADRQEMTTLQRQVATLEVRVEQVERWAERHTP